MSYIDWSDAESLFDMLIEYVSDEKNEAHGDASRELFLSQLLSRLRSMQSASPSLPDTIQKLKGLIQSIDPDFQQDAVMDHLTACVEELERIKTE